MRILSFPRPSPPVISHPSPPCWAASPGPGPWKGASARAQFSVTAQKTPGARPRQYVPTHRILDGPHAVVRADEADRQLEPIVGQPPIDPRVDVADVDAEGVLQPLDLLLADLVAGQRVAPRRFEQDLLDPAAVVAIFDRQVDLVPQVREVAGVIVDRLVEDLVVGDGDDPPGELAAPDPHRWSIGLLLGRLAHL